MIHLRLIIVRSVVAHTGYVGPSCRLRLRRTRSVTYDRGILAS